jgi:hypothetical protein
MVCLMVCFYMYGAYNVRLYVYIFMVHIMERERERERKGGRKGGVFMKYVNMYETGLDPLASIGNEWTMLSVGAPLFNNSSFSVPRLAARRRTGRWLIIIII